MNIRETFQKAKTYLWGGRTAQNVSAPTLRSPKNRGGLFDEDLTQARVFFYSSIGHADDLMLLLASVPRMAATALVNARDENGFTPLIWAASGGRTECVKVLLQVPGIDIDTRSPQDRKTTHGLGPRPKEREECANLLLRRGAVGNIRAEGMSALDWARLGTAEQRPQTTPTLWPITLSYN